MRMILIQALLALALAASAPAGATGRPPMDPAPAHPELRPVLDAFGGVPGLEALMEDFMAALLADPRTRPFFENVEHDRVKRQLVEQFCVILGGDCTYTGRDMRESHEGHVITAADFNALVEVLQGSMDRRGIPFRAQNRLLAKLAPMHRDIVNEPPRP